MQFHQARYLTPTRNPSSLGSRALEDGSSRPAQQAVHQDSMSTNKQLDMVAHICHPSYTGA
jgi:hypothetical protein